MGIDYFIKKLIQSNILSEDDALFALENVNDNYRTYQIKNFLNQLSQGNMVS